MCSSILISRCGHRQIALNGMTDRLPSIIVEMCMDVFRKAGLDPDRPIGNVDNVEPDDVRIDNVDPDHANADNANSDDVDGVIDSDHPNKNSARWKRIVDAHGKTQLQCPLCASCFETPKLVWKHYG